MWASAALACSLSAIQPVAMIPHFTVYGDVDVDAIIVLVKRQKVHHKV